MKIRKIALFVLLALGLCISAGAQIVPWKKWSFLSEKEMAEIIGETSGETAWNTIMATGGFNKDRQAEEYQGTFYESAYILQQLKLYGLKGAEIVRFDSSASGWGGSKLWDGVKGELWEVSPTRQKLASYRDMTAMLAQGSTNADVKAELVWVGLGSKEELEGKKLEGKIVVTEGSISQVHSIACLQMGAAGVVAISNSRPHFDPTQIPWRGIRSWRSKATPKFGFYLTAREGEFLKQRLIRGEKITVHAQVEVKEYDYTLQVPTCIIPGTEEGGDEIIFSAHLFEGYAKQGANDNKSGSAAILEIARTLNTLIEEGRLPRPKRTIRFLWAPEFSGTIPWVKANKEIMARTLCNINMDMVGEHLSLNRGYTHLHRTTYGNPHYINDVMENYYRYVGEGSREKITNRQPLARIVSPTGSDEPFIYTIEEHFGSSDHEVFNDWGVQVPGVMVIVWPDQWYHTSGDRADKADPTQMKRIAVIGSAAAYTVASADDEMAMKIAAEAGTNAVRRIARKLNEAVVELDSATKADFQTRLKTAGILVKAAIINELDTIDSVLELAEDKKAVAAYLKSIKEALELNGKSQQKLLANHAAAVAAKLGIKMAEPRLTELEVKASKLVYKATPLVTASGYRGYSEIIRKLPKETLAKYPYDRNGISDSSEIARLINGRRDLLTIVEMADAQSRRKSSLESVFNYIKILELAGLIEEAE